MLYFLYKIGLSVVNKTDVSGAYKVASSCAAIQYHISKNDRDMVKNNLRSAFPSFSEKEVSHIARNIFVNFGKYLTDFFSPVNKDKTTLSKKMRFEGLENIDEALKRGKGCIIVTGHFGNWELGGCALSERGYKINAVALDHKDPRINSLFIERRKRSGINVAPIGNAKNSCLQALKRNEIVAIVGDRAFGESGIDVEFFGKKARIPRGPALFSIKTGAPLIAGFIYKEDEKSENYRVVMEKPIVINDGVPLRRQLENTMRCFIARFESYIKEYPSQWYVFHRIWG